MPGRASRPATSGRARTTAVRRWSSGAYVKVGVDPFGGTNFSPSVVWSSNIAPHDTWQQVGVTVTTTGPTGPFFAFFTELAQPAQQRLVRRCLPGHRQFRRLGCALASPRHPPPCRLSGLPRRPSSPSGSRSARRFAAPRDRHRRYADGHRDGRDGRAHHGAEQSAQLALHLPRPRIC